MRFFRRGLTIAVAALGVFLVYLAMEALAPKWVALVVALVVGTGVALLLTASRPLHARRVGPHVRVDDIRIGDSIQVGDIQLGDVHVVLNVDPVDALLREQLKPGRVVFNPPAQMRNGERDRVEVRIVRNEALDDLLVTDLRGDGSPVVESIETAVRMRARMTSTDGLRVEALSEELQLVATDRFTEWDYDIWALRSGEQS